MTEDQYINSIRTGKLKLSVGDKFQYFLPSILMISLALTVVVMWILTGTDDIVFSLSIAIVFFTIGSMLYYPLKVQLKFKTVDTTLKRNELINKIEGIIGEWGMSTVLNDDYAYIAQTKPGFGSSEQPTILFDGNKMLVCSICNFKNSKFSIMSLWRNEPYVYDLIGGMEITK